MPKLLRLKEEFMRVAALKKVSWEDKQESAVRFWNQALAASPALVLVRINLAKALLRTGHAEQAQATLRQALEFQPSFQEARDLLNRITK